MSAATGRSVRLRRAATILVADDAPEQLDLFRDTLESEGYAVITCSRVEGALETIEAVRPDLLILDVRMAGFPDWQLFDRVQADPRAAAIPCIVCSAATEELRERRALLERSGCRVLGKPFELDELLGHVRALAGSNLIGLARSPAPEASELRLLTQRHREVAALIARGYSNAEIGDELVLTKGTVANHVQHILTRLGFQNRTQIAVWAVERGLHKPNGREGGGGLTGHTGGR